MVVEHPEVAHPIRRCRTIMSARYEGIGLTADRIPHPPAPLMSGVPRPPDLKLFGVPVAVADDWRIVELFDDVVAWRANVEVQTPVDVVRMDVAGAAVLGPGEPEARANRPVSVQPPLGNVAIPPRLHLAHQHHLRSVDVDRHAGEVARVSVGID